MHRHRGVPAESNRVALFTPDGKRFFRVSASGVPTIRDVATGSPVDAELTRRIGLAAAALSPDGKWILTVSEAVPSAASVWNAATGEPIGQPLVHLNQISRMTFSPDGTLVATASPDGTARVWNLAIGKPVGHPLVHGGAVADLRFVRNGDRWALLTTSFDQTARLWDPVAGVQIGGAVRHRGPVFAPTTDESAGRCVTADYDAARLWAFDPAPARAGGARAAGWVDHVFYSADGNHLITFGVGWLEVWDATTCRPVSKHRTGLNPSWPWPVVVLSPDRKLVAVGGGDRVEVFDVSAGARATISVPCAKPVRWVGFDSTSRILVS